MSASRSRRARWVPPPTNTNMTLAARSEGDVFCALLQQDHRREHCVDVVGTTEIVGVAHHEAIIGDPFFAERAIEPPRKESSYG